MFVKFTMIATTVLRASLVATCTVLNAPVRLMMIAVVFPFWLMVIVAVICFPLISYYDFIVYQYAIRVNNQL